MELEEKSMWKVMDNTAIAALNRRAPIQLVPFRYDLQDIENQLNSELRNLLTMTRNQVCCRMFLNLCDRTV